MTCLFCKLVKGELPSYKIYEDDQTFAFLDISPMAKGHTMVIPKEHAQTFLDASESSVRAIAATIKKLAPSILKATGATGFNILSNNHTSAGQFVEHLHVHIIPRSVGDGVQVMHGEHKKGEDLASLANSIKNAL